MNDLISRQEAIDAIGKDIMGGLNYKSILESLPSAQTDLSEYSNKLWKAAYERGKKEAQPEITRCKDCKHYGIAWLKKDGTDDMRYKNSVCLFGKYAVTHEPDWYCADAERKEDEIQNW